jgi:hypothetical protein
MPKTIWLDDDTYIRLKALKANDEETFAQLIERLMKKKTSLVEPEKPLDPPTQTATQEKATKVIIDWENPLAPNYFLNFRVKSILDGNSQF